MSEYHVRRCGRRALKYITKVCLLIRVMNTIKQCNLPHACLTMQTLGGTGGDIAIHRHEIGIYVSETLSGVLEYHALESSFVLEHHALESSCVLEYYALESSFALESNALESSFVLESFALGDRGRMTYIASACSHSKVATRAKLAACVSTIEHGFVFACGEARKQRRRRMGKQCLRPGEMLSTSQ